MPGERREQAQRRARQQAARCAHGAGAAPVAPPYGSNARPCRRVPPPSLCAHRNDLCLVGAGRPVLVRPPGQGFSPAAPYDPENAGSDRTSDPASSSGRRFPGRERGRVARARRRGAAQVRTAEDADPIEALSTTLRRHHIRPLYTRPAPAPAPAARAATADAWDVRTGTAIPTRRDQRGRAADLETGATSLWLTLGAGGLAVDDLPAALDGVYSTSRRSRSTPGTATASMPPARCSTARRRRPASRAARSAPTRSDCGRAPAPRPTSLLAELAELARPYAEPAHRDGRRHGLPRRRRERRRRTRDRDRGRRRLPARADRRRAVGRRGAGRARVPVRGHGRPVPSIAKLRAARQIWGGSPSCPVRRSTAGSTSTRSRRRR